MMANSLRETLLNVRRACLEHGQQVCQFLRYWTAKEAYLKAIGQGLGGGLSQVIVQPCERLQQASDCSSYLSHQHRDWSLTNYDLNYLRLPASENPNYWQLETGCLRYDYWLAIAIHNPTSTPVSWHITYVSGFQDVAGS